MAYQSKYTGAAIDAGIDINDTQNSRLTTLENNINTVSNNLSTTNTELNKVKNEVIPITRGGTGATNINQAMSNLGGSYATARWDVSSTSGTISTTLKITTHGRPVFVGIQYTMQSQSGGQWGTASIFRDSTHLQSGTAVCAAPSHNQSCNVLYLDIVPAGTYTYTFQYKAGSGTIQLDEISTSNYQETPIIFAFEI